MNAILGNEWRGLRLMLGTSVAGLLAVALAGRVDLGWGWVPSEVLTLMFWGMAVVLGGIPVAQEFENRTVMLGRLQPVAVGRVWWQKLLAAGGGLGVLFAVAGLAFGIGWPGEPVPWAEWLRLGVVSVVSGPLFAFLGRNLVMAAGLNFLGQGLVLGGIWVAASIRDPSAEVATWIWWLAGGCYAGISGLLGYRGWDRLELRGTTEWAAPVGWMPQRRVWRGLRMRPGTPLANLWRKEFIAQRWAILGGFVGALLLVLLRGAFAPAEGWLVAGLVLGVPTLAGVAAGCDRATATQHLSVLQPVGPGGLRVAKLGVALGTAWGFGLFPIYSGVLDWDPQMAALWVGIVTALLGLGFLVSAWSDSLMSALLRTMAAAALILLLSAGAGLLLDRAAVPSGASLAEARIAAGNLEIWDLQEELVRFVGGCLALPLVAGIAWLWMGSRSLSLAEVNRWRAGVSFGVSLLLPLLVFGILCWRVAVVRVGISIVSVEVASRAQREADERALREGPKARVYRLVPSPAEVPQGRHQGLDGR